jgi:hypothetical protein
MLGRSPRQLAVTLLAAALLAGPFVLAFFSGGYFAQPRVVAAIVAWVLAGLAALVVRPRVALKGPSGLALVAFAALTAWTALSATWAPLAGPAGDALERMLLYLGALTAAVLVFGSRRRARWAEPLVALGSLVVIGYGLLGRMLPDVVELSRTASAGGRLDQPLTYWNAEGALAAIGLVVCARLAGDQTRRLALRVAAAAATVPLGLGVYLTFSRGVLSALLVGLAVLLAVAPTWAQLRATAIAVEASAVAVLAASLLPAVRAAEGEDVATQGLIMLAATVTAMGLAALLQAKSAIAERDGTIRDGRLPGGRLVPRLGAVAGVLLALAPFAAGVVAGDEEPVNPAFGATAERFASVGSHRYEYWRVALEAFAEDPLKGTGAGGFRVAWLEERRMTVPLRDAHSVELEFLSQLGLVGLILLLAVFWTVFVAARRLARTDALLVAGPAAALAVWGAHSAIDWDWQMPALTLVAVVLAGVVLARAQAGAQLVDERPLPTERKQPEDAEEDGQLDDGLPERPLAAPQHQA